MESTAEASPRPTRARCYLCDEADPDTRDHVFPKQLFTGPPAPDQFTAPAHRRCNGGLMEDEAYFRAFVLIGNREDQGARDLWDGPVLRQLNKPDFQGLRKRLLAETRAVERYSPGGIYLGSGHALDADPTEPAGSLRRSFAGSCGTTPTGTSCARTCACG
jgi:hypothetical protein